jgi:succinate dehydrogenase / fumarate reductase, cytochrome b subunit
MTAPTSRPLSPHLTIWKWGPHMLVSILHRATGSALTFAGLALLTWWLLAIANGADAYEQFVAVANHPLGVAVLVGLTWAFWQHFFSGLRHLFMDMGAGFELKINKLFAVLTIAAALLATAATWFVLMGVNR